MKRKELERNLTKLIDTWNKLCVEDQRELMLTYPDIYWAVALVVRTEELDREFQKKWKRKLW